MPDDLKFHFPIAILLNDGGPIIAGAKKYASQLQARLPADRVTQIEALLEQVSQQQSGQKEAAGALGELTQEQNNALKPLFKWMSRARDTAKLAFKGQDVKLREQFQVGVTKPNTLAAHKERARTVITSCRNADNATALAAQGWIAADTDAMEVALAALGTADETQETAKGGKKGVTGNRNRNANDLFDGLLAIQNAASLQFPEDVPDNIAIRAEFRLNTFPPKNGGNKKKPQTPDNPPAPPAK